MTDHSELKRLAEAATTGPWSMCGEADGSQGFEIIQDIWNEHGTHTGKDVVVYEWSDESDPLGVIHRADAEFIAAANPVAVLALIADLDEARNGMKHSCAIRLKKRIELLETQRDQLIADNERLTNRLEVDPRHDYDGISTRDATVKVLDEQVDQLKAENERLSTENSEIESAAITYIEDMQEAQRENARLTELFTVGMTLDGNLRVYGDWQSVRKAQEILAERDQLRAEIAGLKTGYEAYERVNAELKAEVEALRKDAERYRWLRDSDYAGKILRDMGAKYRADADQRIDAALGQGEQS